jgi:hypothetical protein
VNSINQREETMQHIYHVNPVECQPQWYNEPPRLNRHRWIDRCITMVFVASAALALIGFVAPEYHAASEQEAIGHYYGVGR